MSRFRPALDRPLNTADAQPVDPGVWNRKVTRTFEWQTIGAAIDQVQHTAVCHNHDDLPGMRINQLLDTMATVTTITTTTSARPISTSLPTR